MSSRSILVGAFALSMALPPSIGAPEDLASGQPVGFGARSTAELEEQREAALCWRQLASVDPGDGRANELRRLTLDRFLETAHARALVLDLCIVFAAPSGNELTSTVVVRFVDRVPDALDTPEGSFQPAVAGAARYEILVQTRYRDAATEPTVFVFGEWPNNPECAYTFFYRQAASMMAQTLYHELLHVWFVNQPAAAERPFPTGHGQVAHCQFEPEFLELLSGNAHELSQIEGHIPLNKRTVPIGLR
jgi:hypothetical protein